MADVVKTRGSLYFLRDIDYLSGKKGAYVKIGIVRKDKSTEARIKEHQTGNPRGIVDEYTLADVPFVEALETHLHYHFNEKWIAGEWFHMNEIFVKEVVVKEAKRLRKEQLKFEDQIYAAEALSTQVSNGKKRKATAAELKLKAKYSKIKLEADIADAYLKIARSTLLQTIGNTGFIEGVFHLTKSKDSLKFDASAFKKENETLYNSYCEEKEGGFLKTFKVLGTKKLKEENHVLYDESRNLPKDDYSIADLDKTKKRSKKIEQAHWVFLQAQRERKILDWELTKLEAQLKYTISDYNEIEEVCTWERRQKDPTISFNMDLFKEKEPEEYKKYLKSKKGSVLPKLELTRPYPTN